ncbi:NAD(P)/FAD-dependent oxidoreductase [Cellulosilyticum lentocellum]|uniref:Amine oxidase n=1 Tax=Cellulosilyticum lentocellum (strain ATCC 49066 / DSM 5427 / NCIMB 11756 / RHM5) TaxID=642492 RepID=F2JJJ9_CELLD|nr:NAD(P)/FAD-dependent oxidoreductase [Cellulosilyticum lentocellum]ADZ85594.1 amine oxidase [Cellulosilyticum lentocellum DSM 5427]
MREKKKVLIIGAGVAGLTSALELLRRSDDYLPIVIEQESKVGGLARTVTYKGNSIDMGGHRFFSKDERIVNWWLQILSVEQGDMLIRERQSHIFFKRKFFDYPITLGKKTLAHMGLKESIKVSISYIVAKLKKRQEVSLEDFMINRFGKVLYGMFFEDYTYKVWGKHPSEIDASWGIQRIKGLSLSKALWNAFLSLFPKRKKVLLEQHKETSLIEQFIYPKYGPGQLWQKVAEEITLSGGIIKLNTKVTGVRPQNEDSYKVEITTAEGKQDYITVDYIISSMPIKDLVLAMQAKGEVARIAQELPYRDFITVGMLIDKEALHRHISSVSFERLMQDNWIYIQEKDVRLGRLQVFNNWSPYLAQNTENTLWLGLEYFCEEGDELWCMSDESFISFAKEELTKLGLIQGDEVLDAIRYKVPKAYPAYFGSYKEFDKVRAYLESFDKLYCVGRNGQHHYNNMDHSMKTAFVAVENILANKTETAELWDVNVEQVYHETKKKEKRNVNEGNCYQ